MLENERAQQDEVRCVEMLGALDRKVRQLLVSLTVFWAFSMFGLQNLDESEDVFEQEQGGRRKTVSLCSYGNFAVTEISTCRTTAYVLAAIPAASPR